MNMNMGMVGEFRCVLENEAGLIKTDTGYQKNLILDQGLDYLGGGFPEAGNEGFFNTCFIGTGNDATSVEQTSMAGAYMYAGGELFDHSYKYKSNPENLYKPFAEYKYVFNDLGSVNIAELGLACSTKSLSDYILCTRALIKDEAGSPTVISATGTDRLTVYYRITAVFSTAYTRTTINLLDGKGGSRPYLVDHCIAKAGTLANYGPLTIGKKLITHLSFYGSKGYVSSGLIGRVDGTMSGTTEEPTSVTNEPYVKGSFKLKVITYCDTSKGNTAKGLFFNGAPGSWQMHYTDPITNEPGLGKTSTDTMSLPVEFSWGRYNGSL